MTGELRNSQAKINKKAMLSQGELRNAAVNFDMYQVTTASHISCAMARHSCWVAHWTSSLGVRLQAFTPQVR